MNWLIVSFGFGLIFLTACNSGEWPLDEQEKFMKECSDEGGGERYCSCYLHEVMKKYQSADEAEQMDFETAVELASKCE